MHEKNSQFILLKIPPHLIKTFRENTRFKHRSSYSYPLNSQNSFLNNLSPLGGIFHLKALLLFGNNLLF